MRKNAIILLHEIYGRNTFIEVICQNYRDRGFDVFCPSLIDRQPFHYDEAHKAYEYFMKTGGFTRSQAISAMVTHLKESYEKVILIGFSVGATIAWKCCENTACDAIVGCYGSRIRDDMQMSPNCPTLLLFSQEDSFDVNIVVDQLQEKVNLEIHIFSTKHGFMDRYSPNYDRRYAQDAEDLMLRFLSEACHKDI